MNDSSLNHLLPDELHIDTQLRLWPEEPWCGFCSTEISGFKCFPTYHDLQAHYRLCHSWEVCKGGMSSMGDRDELSVAEFEAQLEAGGLGEI